MKWARLTQSAPEDIDRARAWYDAGAVGDAFIGQIENTLALIPLKPELYAQVYKGIRRADLKRFPHGLFFSLEADAPVVIARLHHKRGSMALLAAHRKNQGQ